MSAHIERREFISLLGGAARGQSRRTRRRGQRQGDFQNAPQNGQSRVTRKKEKGVGIK